MRWVFLILSVFGGQLAASCEEVFFLCDKQYVERNQIVLQEDQIQICLPGSELSTSALYRDAKGFYFKDFKKQGDCPDGKWECKVCHFCNPQYTLYCGACWN